MAFKMNGSPAKMGTIQGTTGHSSALKQKKSETIERINEAGIDPEVEEVMRTFHKPTPAVTPKKLSDAQVKAIKKALKEKLKDPKTIKKLKDASKKGYTPTSPAKQGEQQSSGSEKIQKQQTSKAGQLLRQKQIDAVDAKIETLEEQIFNEEITQEQYDEAMKPLRIKEKQVKKPI